MKKFRMLLVGLVISPLVQAQTDEPLQTELQLKVADEYSRCGAYYEISSAVRDATNGIGADDARVMKDESMAMAAALAANADATLDGEKYAEDRYAAAIEDMHDLITTDQDAFRDWALEQRKNCRLAVNDASAFVDRTLTEYTGTQRKSRYLTWPKGVTVEDILKHGKPVDSFPDISKCAATAERITISLDDVLREDGLICTERRGDGCASERSWTSSAGYIESLHPDREIQGHSENVSITFKNGQTQEQRTLIACLTAP